MQRKTVRTLPALAAIAVTSFGGIAVAEAAGHHKASGTSEVALTGTDLSSAEAAAVAANSGATASGASTETDSSLTGAKYEVKITKADGSKAVVIEDASFTVLATNADTGHRGH